MKIYYPFATELYKHTIPPRLSNEFNQVRVYDADEVDKEIEQLKKAGNKIKNNYERDLFSHQIWCNYQHPSCKWCNCGLADLLEALKE